MFLRRNWRPPSSDEPTSGESPSFVQQHAPKTEPVVAFEKFPAFPSLSDLLDPIDSTDPKKSPHPLVALSEPPEQTNPGLFQAFLGNRLEVLADDIQRNPDVYDDDTKALVERLLQRQGEISTQDRLVLDRAVASFALPRAAKQAIVRPQPKGPKPLKTVPRGDTPVAGEDFLPEDLAPYWWAK